MVVEYYRAFIFKYGSIKCIAVCSQYC